MIDKSAYLKRLRMLMAQYGWVVQYVGEGEGECEFAYTVGLYQFNHPEFIIFGIPPTLSRALLNDMGRRVRDGGTFTHGQVVSDLVRGFDTCLVEVINSRDHLTVANAIAEHPPEFALPALQVVYPDAAHLWPWEVGSRVAGTPLLGVIPNEVV